MNFHNFTSTIEPTPQRTKAILCLIRVLLEIECDELTRVPHRATRAERTEASRRPAVQDHRRSARPLHVQPRRAAEAALLLTHPGQTARAAHAVPRGPPPTPVPQGQHGRQAAARTRRAVPREPTSILGSLKTKQR